MPAGGRQAAAADRGARGGALRRAAEDANRETRETKPTPAMPPQSATAISVKVSPSEPLDGRDPNPREGA